MKAFTVHDIFKIAQFTDAPCITLNLSRHYPFSEIIMHLDTYIQSKIPVDLTARSASSKSTYIIPLHILWVLKL